MSFRKLTVERLSIRKTKFVVFTFIPTLQVLFFFAFLVPKGPTFVNIFVSFDL
jgi:hypothetical protein